MPNQALKATLAGLDVSPVELALLIEESEATVLAWTGVAGTSPRWLDLLVESWRDHPQMLAIARDNAAARLGTARSVEDDVVFA